MRDSTFLIGLIMTLAGAAIVVTIGILASCDCTEREKITLGGAFVLAEVCK